MENTNITSGEAEPSKEDWIQIRSGAMNLKKKLIMSLEEETALIQLYKSKIADFEAEEILNAK